MVSSFVESSQTPIRAAASRPEELVQLRMAQRWRWESATVLGATSLEGPSNTQTKGLRPHPSRAASQLSFAGRQGSVPSETGGESSRDGRLEHQHSTWAFLQGGDLISPER